MLMQETQIMTGRDGLARYSCVANKSDVAGTSGILGSNFTFPICYSFLYFMTSISLFSFLSFITTHSVSSRLHFLYLIPCMCVYSLRECELCYVDELMFVIRWIHVYKRYRHKCACPWGNQQCMHVCEAVVVAQLSASFNLEIRSLNPIIGNIFFFCKFI